MNEEQTLSRKGPSRDEQITEEQTKVNLGEYSECKETASKPNTANP